MNRSIFTEICRIIVLVPLILLAESLIAQDQPSASLGAAPTKQNHIAGTAELNRLLTGIVLEHLPHQYVEDKKWGHQEQRWSGIEFRRDGDGGLPETQRRYRMVNHGTWRKYSVELVDPQNQFTVALPEVSKTANGLTAFTVNFAARLKVSARQSKWVNGVQLYSVSADGRADIRLQVRCEMDTGLDFKNFPPDLVFKPTVTEAQIHVDDFRLDRISKIGGEVAQQLARRARSELDKRIEAKELDLVEKINNRIAKNQDRLRLSLADAVKLDWYTQTREFLPESVKQTLERE